MKTIEQIFEAAKAGSLWAGNLIPNHADSGRKLENRTPIDNSLIGYIADGSEQDIDAAVRAARSAFSDDLWAGKSPSEKRAVLLRWAQLIEEHAEELAAFWTVSTLASPSASVSTPICPPPSKPFISMPNMWIKPLVALRQPATTHWV